jgi:hypothetical protein
MRRVVWLALFAVAGCGPQVDESNSHLGMEREVVITAGSATSVPLKLGLRGVVQVRNGAKVWADDVLPFDTAERDVIVTVRGTDIVSADGKGEDSTGNMPRKYLRAARWKEAGPDRVPVKRLMFGRLATDGAATR